MSRISTPAFLCKEEPAKVRARMARREDIFSDDELALYLDTFHDSIHLRASYRCVSFWITTARCPTRS
jgi:hypothetical protein